MCFASDWPICYGYSPTGVSAELPVAHDMIVFRVQNLQCHKSNVCMMDPA